MAQWPQSVSLPDPAMLAAALLAVQPLILGGAVLRSPCGPRRDAWTRYLDSLPKKRLAALLGR